MMVGMDVDEDALREALEDMWGCIGINEIKQLQPETIRVARENHIRLSHADESG